MSGSMTSGVSLANLLMEQWQLPFNLAAGMTAADIGRVVTMDSVANTVRLAADNEEILGRLETFEDRASEGLRVGTVSVKGAFVVPSIATVPAIGAQVTGGTTNGLVKTAMTPVVGRRAMVVDRNPTALTVTIILQ